MNADYQNRLRAFGFSELEISAVELVLMRVGLLTPGCEHERLRFLNSWEPDKDAFVNHERWRMWMEGIGFKTDVILMAEHAIGQCPINCEFCPTKGTA